MRPSGLSRKGWFWYASGAGLILLSLMMALSFHGEL
jgi:hypothetical protein